MITKDKKRTTRKPRKIVKLTVSRVKARVSEEEKHIIKKAAGLLQLSLSDFIRTKMVAIAEEVIEDEERVELSEEETRKIVDSILSKRMPKKSFEKLKRGVEKYKEAKLKGILKSSV